MSVVAGHQQKQEQRRYGNATQTLCGRTQQEPRRRLLLFYATNVHPQGRKSFLLHSLRSPIFRPNRLHVVQGTDRSRVPCGMSCPPVTSRCTLTLTRSTEHWEFGPEWAGRGVQVTSTNTQRLVMMMMMQRNPLEWQRVGQYRGCKQKCRRLMMIDEHGN